MNLEHARFNMIAQQIRPWDVLDETVLDTLTVIKRETFVPADYQNLAFADIEIPLGLGESMMFPRVEGRILQALAISPEDTCLEIGTGSGFLTACLAHLSKHVDSVDIHEDFTRQAEEKLLAAGFKNYSLHTGDALREWTATQPYNVIVVTGSMPIYKAIFEQHLAAGGRLFIVVGTGASMQATLVTRQADGEFVHELMFATSLKPLVGAEPSPEASFVF